MKLSFLYGATFGTLVRLLFVHRFLIPLKYIPRYAAHLLISIFNSLLSIPDLFYRDKGMPDKIVFLLGHYRCGTTHLLNLMSVDGTYIPPTTYQSVFPNSFLATEKLLSPLFNLIGPGVRAMDNMAMRMESPQEEEIALAALGASTPYLAVHFPVSGQFYKSCISFEDANKRDLDNWKNNHQKFIRKLVKKHGSKTPLILKSPANTARIPLLLEMYPNASFVYIHRNPYKTIQSSIHLYRTWYKMANFQPLDQLQNNLTQTVLDVYEQINRKWIQDRHLIPVDKQITVSFSELQKEPVETLRKIYETLGNGELNAQKLQLYLDSIKTYKKNNYETLSNELISKINNQMDFVFKEFGYHKIQ